MDAALSRGIEYISRGKNNGGQIRNSYLIEDEKEMYMYATELLTNSQYKDDISGSVEGVVLEWKIHNYAHKILSKFGFDSLADRAAHVDLGNTIYDDRTSISFLGFSIEVYAEMWDLYAKLFPEQAEKDWKTYKKGGV